MEASVYDVEAKQAREIVIHGKFPAIALGGDDGLTSSYTGARFKRIWVDHSEYPIYNLWFRCIESHYTIRYTEAGTLGNTMAT